MSEVTMYHNPRCTKCRLTLELLREKNIEPTVVEYLKTPPTQEEIRELVRQLGGGADALLRKKEARYKELGLEGKTDDEKIQAMAENPVLIERPLVVKNERAALGRPPENILEIL